VIYLPAGHVRLGFDNILDHGGKILEVFEEGDGHHGRSIWSTKELELDLDWVIGFR
jgi:hypothetical protein